jgi:hypothetical protein
VEAESNGEPSDTEPDRMDLELLVIGKKAGLTFEEMNLMRVRDLLKYVQIYTGNDEGTEVRQATQADFDRW